MPSLLGGAALIVGLTLVLPSAWRQRLTVNPKSGQFPVTGLIVCNRILQTVDPVSVLKCFPVEIPLLLTLLWEMLHLGFLGICIFSERCSI